MWLNGEEKEEPEVVDDGQDEMNAAAEAAFADDDNDADDGYEPPSRMDDVD